MTVMDGRRFGWQRTRGVASVTIPVIVWDPMHGCCSRCEIIDLRPLKAHEYGLTLAELMEAYPEPKVKRDYED